MRENGYIYFIDARIMPLQETRGIHAREPHRLMQRLYLFIVGFIQPFQHILRLLNTNIDGKRKIMYALTEIKGVGRRYANVVCKKADVDLAKRWVDIDACVSKGDRCSAVCLR